jgi:hypothetical protein
MWILSPRNEFGMRQWLESRSYAREIKVVDSWAKVYGEGPSLVLVANQAREHAATIEIALRLGHRVICEKPLALNLPEATSVVELGERLERPVLAANVYLFAEYLRHFAQLVTEHGRLEHVSIDWADPLDEWRYGERKTVDHSVDVVADVLPHALCLLSFLGIDRDTRIRDLAVERGGAKVLLHLDSERCPVTVRLERNASNRRRAVIATTASGSVGLDFAREPGQLRTNDGVIVSACDEWAELPTPLTQIVSAAWLDVTEGVHDGRLSTEIPHRACRLRDELSPVYERLRSLSIARLLEVSPDSPDLAYGIEEAGLQARAEPQLN